jgi:hypothetical protein
MALRSWRLPALALAGACFSATPLPAADAPKPKEIASFGTLQAPTADAAKAQAAAWYARSGGKDQAKFDAIWGTDRPMLEKIADTLALGNADAAKILKEARDANSPAPEGIPGLLKDKKVDNYLRSNLALAYAKALVNRRIFDEAQLALSAIKAEDVVDPAAYFFTKAVAEYSLMAKSEASLAVLRLLEDVSDAPERYRMVAALMQFDMLTWQDNDLGWVSRKMGVIADRLDIVRGGEKTRKMQKEVLVRLEEMIKEKENQQKQQQQQQQPGQPGQPKDNEGQCPPGGPPQNGPPGNTNQPSNPLQDSQIAHASGKGEIDQKEKSKITENWGNLPEKDRAKAIVELTRELPREMRESVDIYIKKLGEKEGASNK